MVIERSYRHVMTWVMSILYSSNAVDFGSGDSIGPSAVGGGAEKLKSSNDFWTCWSCVPREIVAIAEAGLVIIYQSYLDI